LATARQLSGSELRLLIAGAVLVPILIGVLTGATMKPQGAWKDTLNVAAAGMGAVAGLLALAIVSVMVAQPTECTSAGCHETDTTAAIQLVFLVPLLIPIYALVLPGAAIGKLLGRGIRRLAYH
jgi:hypothetical protein